MQQPDTPPTTNKEAAHYLADLGFMVFPLFRVKDGSCTCHKGRDCRDAGKHPATPNGFKDATRDHKEIDLLWTHPDMGVGLRTGEASGVDILDVDVKDRGLETLATYEKHNGPLPETPWVSTPSGGRHYYFRHRAGQGRRIKFLPGLDILGDNGFAVAPPSQHKSGGFYKWQIGPGERPFADWPDALVQMIGNPQHQDDETEECEVVVANPPSYVDAAKKAILQTLRDARDGERHNTLVSQSFILGRYVGEFLTEDEARDGLIDAVASWGTVPGYKEMDAISWGLKHGMTKPKKVIQTALAIVPDGLVSIAPVDSREKLPKLPEKTIEWCYDRQEQGDADMLARLYKGRLYVSGKDVYIWGHHHWEVTDKHFVYVLITNQVADQYLMHSVELANRALAETDKGKKDELAERSKSYSSRSLAARNSRRAEGVYKLFCGIGKLPPGWQWDSNPLILGVENGVIELETGELREGHPDDKVLAYVPVEYTGKDQPAPLWEKTLGEIFADQPAMIGFMQRLLGYGLSGLSQEHVMPVLWGEGRNGKDTLIETLGKVLGEDVASVVSRDVFLGGRHDTEGNRGAATPHIMSLRGKRIVWCAEATGRFNVEQVKLITGGNIVKGRQLYGKEEQFLSTHLPLLITNDKPSAPPDATALWDRLILVSFNQRFVDDPKEENEHKKDVGLKDRLVEEGSGILSWLVRGFLEWRAKGLCKPEEVIKDTQAYQHENDLLGQFLEEFGEEGDFKTPMAVIYSGYSHYLTHIHGYSRLPSSNSVGKQMAKKYKNKRTEKGMVYLGIRLKMTPDEIFNEVVRMG